MNTVPLKFSIITITYNSAATVEATLRSISGQLYPNIEHIIIDGGSKDNTIEICKKYPHISTLISEKDDGIYDALNKGIQKSTGDIIGILHSDDVFSSDKVLETIADFFLRHQDTDATIGDVILVKNEGNIKLKRTYRSNRWSPKMFAWGKMPPHPSFFCKREVYDKFGLYKTDYKIASDYEFLMRVFIKGKIEFKYLPLVTTIMKIGGASTKNLKSTFLLNKEIVRACHENKIYTNLLMIYSKYFYRIFEFIS